MRLERFFCGVFVAGLLLLMFSRSVWADVDDKTKQVANQAIDNIESKIKAVAQNYDVLADFVGVTAVINEYGFKEINYAPQIPGERNFELVVRMLSMEALDGRQGKPEYREAIFPLFGIKAAWFVRGETQIERLNIDELIKEELRLVEKEQQGMLPLALTIEASKETYKVGDRIEFGLVLKNIGRNSLKVKRLDEKSTYCLINGQRWGTKDPSGEDAVILRPGDVTRKKLKVSGVEAPGNFEISCSYGAGFKGVRPSAVKTLRIKQ